MRCPENFARAGAGKWEEELNFLDSFCFVFLIKEKNESLSGRKIIRLYRLRITYGTELCLCKTTEVTTLTK